MEIITVFIAAGLLAILKFAPIVLLVMVIACLTTPGK